MSSDTHSMVRVLEDPPLTGPTNMARDEALLTRVGAGASGPTLRLYQWDPPTISLGYFQRFAEYQALLPPAGDLPVVRRLTGGGAILHDQELTYSLALPIDHKLVSHGPNRLYELAHEAIIASLGNSQEHPTIGNPQSAIGRVARSSDSLAVDGTSIARPNKLDRATLRNPQSEIRTSSTLGPFFCFARRHRFDVLIGEDKVAGSAQRRTRHALLQHGSIILGNRFSQQPTATVELGYDEAVHTLRRTMVRNMASVFGETLEPGEWNAEELATAEALLEKYAGDAWTRRR